MYRRLIFVTVFTLVLLMAFASLADTDDEARSIRMNYNLDLITSGVNFYYWETGSMPQSVAEMYEAGWIPGNLKNPFSDEPFDLYSEEAVPGNIFITANDSENIDITMVNESGRENSIPFGTSLLCENDKFGPKLTLYNYLSRMQYAFFAYGAEFGEVPSSLDDLEEAEYWPFAGGESNPYTGDPLEFLSDATGNLEFTFSEDAAQCRANYTENRVSVARLDLETALSRYERYH